jgi:cytochrome d ubiquinol oxidase subunit I
VHATDWWAIVFTPSLPYRLAHMLIASALTCAFLIAGISAWRWLRGDRAPSVQAALRTGVVMAAVLAPTQLVVGDLHGLNTLEHQPAKVAAMEGNWETRGHVPLVLFAIPDEAARENRFEIAIPSGASLILRHSAAGEVPGLNDFRGEHPPVAPVFFAFRVMVGTGMLMIAAGLLSAWLLWRRGTLPEHLPPRTSMPPMPRFPCIVCLCVLAMGRTRCLSSSASASGHARVPVSSLRLRGTLSTSRLLRASSHGHSSCTVSVRGSVRVMRTCCKSRR